MACAYAYYDSQRADYEPSFFDMMDFNENNERASEQDNERGSRRRDNSLDEMDLGMYDDDRFQEPYYKRMLPR